MAVSILLEISKCGFLTFSMDLRFSNICKVSLWLSFEPLPCRSCRENDDCMFISLDVPSLFTNVPLKKTVNIILKRIYNETQIPTSLSKPSLKKRILDICQKTAFSFHNKMYEQLDGVSMAGSLGLVLANIIMIECEKVIVGKLIEDGITKFYIRYFDNTLLVIKRTDISCVLNKFNSFDDNLKFTIKTFQN